jgi:hypothetical protein
MTTIEHAYNRFSTERFPLPSEAQLHALEKRIGVTFPEDYRHFVLKYNGGYFSEPEITPVSEECPRDALTFLSGIGASHEESELGRQFYMSLFDDNDPPKIVPIGRTSLGALIILDTAPGESQGEIFLKQAFGGFYYLADGIEEFFGLLQEPPWGQAD